MNQEDLIEEGKPIYDLEERTFQFAKRIRKWIKKLPHSVANLEDSKQLVRASGSVGANYIEANEALSKRILFFDYGFAEKKQKNRLIGPD